MAVTAKWFGKAFTSAFTKKIDLSADTVKVMLCTNGYTPDQDAHDFKDDVTNEASGGGYVAGGITMTSPSVSYDGGTNKMKFDGGDVTFTNPPTCRYAVVYDASPATDATRPLLMWVDFGADIIPVGINWHADGIATVTVA